MHRMTRKPAVEITVARCRLCSGSRADHIVSGRIRGEDTGWRLTSGCKSTFGVGWRVLRKSERARGKSRRYWVKRFWETEQR